MAKRAGRLRQKSWPDHAVLLAAVSTTVPFQDADPTGLAWHGNYFRYYDLARVELLKKLNFGYRQMAELGQFWPIVDTRVRYISSVSFGQEITISAQLVEWEFRLTLYYEIHNSAGDRINEAYTIQVPVEAATEALILGLPEQLTTKITNLIAADTPPASQTIADD